MNEIYVGIGVVLSIVVNWILYRFNLFGFSYFVDMVCLLLFVVVD